MPPPRGLRIRSAPRTDRATARRGLVLAGLVAALSLPHAALALPWIGRHDGVDSWRTLDPVLTDGFFGSGSYVVGENVQRFTSLESFTQASASAGSWVMYDIERGSPVYDQTYPRRAMRRFVELAHARGAYVILSPIRRYALRGVSLPADLFLLQSQRLECDLTEFTAFVAEAKAQAGSPLLVELTVVWSDPCVTVDTVVAAWRAALPYADGYGLWGLSTDPEGVDVMRQVTP